VGSLDQAAGGAVALAFATAWGQLKVDERLGPAVYSCTSSEIDAWRYRIDVDSRGLSLQDWAHAERVRRERGVSEPVVPEAKRAGSVLMMITFLRTLPPVLLFACTARVAGPPPPALPWRLPPGGVIVKPSKPETVTSRAPLPQLRKRTILVVGPASMQNAAREITWEDAERGKPLEHVVQTVDYSVAISTAERLLLDWGWRPISQSLLARAAYHEDVEEGIKGLLRSGLSMAQAALLLARSLNIESILLLRAIEVRPVVSLMCRHGSGETQTFLAFDGAVDAALVGPSTGEVLWTGTTRVSWEDHLRTNISGTVLDDGQYFFENCPRELNQVGCRSPTGSRCATAADHRDVVRMVIERAATELLGRFQAAAQGGKAAHSQHLSSRSPGSSASPVPSPSSSLRLARLVVTSVPSGAAVRLAGREIGPTPTEVITVEPGNYEIEVRMEGYQTWKETVPLRAGESEPVVARLGMLPTTIQVMVTAGGEMTWATISIDGEVVGDMQVAERSVRPGKHIVSAKRAGYRTAYETVVLRPGEKQQVKLALEKE
jgi:hypothetical protein